MNLPITVTQNDLLEILLNIALSRPVFIAKLVTELPKSKQDISGNMLLCVPGKKHAEGTVHHQL